MNRQVKICLWALLLTTLSYGNQVSRFGAIGDLYSLLGYFLGSFVGSYLLVLFIFWIGAELASGIEIKK